MELLQSTSLSIAYFAGVLLERALARATNGRLIQSRENGRLDYGFLHTDDKQEVHTIDTIEFSATKWSGLRNDTPPLLGIESKSASLRFFGTNVGPADMNYLHSINRSPLQQRECSAFIIGNARDPTRVLFVPASELQSRAARFLGQTLFYRPVIRTGENLQPFPVELAPYCVPLRSLSTLLDQTAQWKRGAIEKVVNPVHGCAYTNWEDAPQIGVDRLYPQKYSGNEDFTWIDDLIWSLGAFGDKFSVESIEMRPSVGDFAIVDRRTQERAAAEMKQVSMTQVDQKRGSFRCRQSQFSDRDPVSWIRRRIFSYLRRVDYYFMQIESGWMLLPREVLPDTWFTEHQSDDGWTGWFNCGREILQRYIIDYNPIEGPCFVRQFEAILSKQRYLTALKPPPRYKPDAYARAQVNEAVIARLTGNFGLKETFSLTRSGVLNAASAFLTRLCHNSNAGTIQPVDARYVSSHVFSPVGAKSLVELMLYPTAPVVLLNFASISTLDASRPALTSGYLSMRPALYRDVRSLFIFTCLPAEMRDRDIRSASLQQTYFLIPSERIQISDNGEGKACKFALVESDSIHLFATTALGCIDFLQNLLRLEPDDRQFPVGGEGRSHPLSIDPDHYVMDMRAVTKRFHT